MPSLKTRRGCIVRVFERESLGQRLSESEVRMQQARIGFPVSQLVAADGSEVPLMSFDGRQSQTPVDGGPMSAPQFCSSRSLCGFNGPGCDQSALSLKQGNSSRWEGGTYCGAAWNKEDQGGTVSMPSGIHKQRGRLMVDEPLNVLHNFFVSSLLYRANGSDMGPLSDFLT